MHPTRLLREGEREGMSQTMGNARRAGLTDLHMIVLSWLCFHPNHGPEDVAKGLRADVDEIERLCADLVVAGFIEPLTLH